MKKDAQEHQSSILLFCSCPNFLEELARKRRGPQRLTTYSNIPVIIAN